jgi:hypothetical protein
MYMCKYDLSLFTYSRIPAWERREVVVIDFIACLGHFPVDLFGSAIMRRQQHPQLRQQHIRLSFVRRLSRAFDLRLASESHGCLEQ